MNARLPWRVEEDRTVAEKGMETTAPRHDCGKNTEIVSMRKWMKEITGFKCPLIPAIFKGEYTAS